MTGFEEMQCKLEVDFVLRTKELHEYHLQQLEDNEGLYENFSKEYGVTNRSILLDALYSDVSEQISQDVMHVILDGSLSRTLYFIIHYFLDNNIFTLQGLNAFILDFNYGYSEMKDKPVYQFG